VPLNSISCILLDFFELAVNHLGLKAASTVEYIAV